MKTDFISTPSYYMDWIEGGLLVANPPWYDETRTGVYGVGSHATAEKGRHWLESAIDEEGRPRRGDRRTARAPRQPAPNAGFSFPGASKTT